jgi:hypothetical protein
MKRREFWKPRGCKWLIILKLILQKYGMEVWIGFIWFRYGPVESCYEYGNEPSGSIK